MATHVKHESGTPDEAAILRRFSERSLEPSRWSNGPGYLYASHSHQYRKLLYCLRGSITFELTASGERFAVSPGDRLEIEPGTAHSAVVGPEGVECVEAPVRTAQQTPTPDSPRPNR